MTFFIQFGVKSLSSRKKREITIKITGESMRNFDCLTTHPSESLKEINKIISDNEINLHRFNQASDP